MLDKVKLALRITTNAFDDEITELIFAAKADLEIVGAEADENEPLIAQAIVTYCKVNFGSPDEYDRLKKSYDEQKAQLRANPMYSKEG